MISVSIRISQTCPSGPDLGPPKALGSPVNSALLGPTFFREKLISLGLPYPVLDSAFLAKTRKKRYGYPGNNKCRLLEEKKETEKEKKTKTKEASIQALFSPKSQQLPHHENENKHHAHTQRVAHIVLFPCCPHRPQYVVPLP